MFLKAIIILLVLGTVIGKTDQQIYDCIKQTQIKSPICPDNGIDCENSRLGMSLCLLLNGCYNHSNKNQMKIQCWNCWVDLLSSDQHFLQFQTLIKKSCYESHLMIMLFVLVLLSIII